MLFSEARLRGVDDLHERCATEHVQIARERVRGRSKPLARQRQGGPVEGDARERSCVKAHGRHGTVLRLFDPGMEDDEGAECDDERAHRDPRPRAPAPPHDADEEGHDANGNEKA